MQRPERPGSRSEIDWSTYLISSSAPRHTPIDPELPRTIPGFQTGESPTWRGRISDRGLPVPRDIFRVLPSITAFFIEPDTLKRQCQVPG